MGVIGIIILNYNNYEDTFNCIKSIESYNTATIKYIIVDNGSSRNNTVEEISDFVKCNFNGKNLILKEGDAITYPLPYVTFLYSLTNDGYAQGNNKGLKLAYQDHSIDNILIINNDVLFVEDILPQMVKLQEVLPDCGLISPVLFKKDLAEYDYNCARLCESNWEIIFSYLVWYKDLFGLLTKMKKKRLLLMDETKNKVNKYIEVETPSGSCMLAKKHLWEIISGFDPNTFLYYEENILFKKLKKINLKNCVFPSIKCVHLGACSTSKHGKGNYKMTKIKIESTNYYITQYGEMNALQKIIYSIAKVWINTKLLLIKIIG